MSKGPTWWVPELLTPDQKHTRLVTLQVNLTLFEADTAGFLERFLIQDECKARDQTGERPVFSPSKEGRGGVIAREGDGLYLLGYKGHCVH